MERSRPNPVDLVVVGKALIGDTIENVAIAVDEGFIVSVTTPALAPQSVARVEFGEKFLILPGMVDIHVHMREPGLEHKEDWRTGSRAAARGGVTLVADMPNNRPPANTCERLREKLSRAASKSIVDFAFYAGFNPDPEELDHCRDLFIGFKLYPEALFSPGASSVFSYASRSNLPVVVHAEDPSLFRDSAIHSEARPAEAEVLAVEYALKLALNTRAWIHVTHLSTRAALRRVLDAKLSQGLRVTFDVTPHHVFLTDELYRKETWRIAVVNPPLRGESDRASLYSALRGMLPDALVTDHAPHLLEEKLSQTPPPGFPGLELALHLLLREVLAGRMSLGVLGLYSRMPARLLGVKKGVIAPGFDGDITVVALEDWVVKGSELESKAKYTPFEGWVLPTKTYAVYIRGEPVYMAGQFMVDRGGRLAVPRG
ncbi:MAG: dihydroorotase family protein [Infirmifilum sp.]